MTSTDSLARRVSDDSNHLKKDGDSHNHALDEIYGYKKADDKPKSDSKADFLALKEQGLLPGLELTEDKHFDHAMTDKPDGGDKPVGGDKSDGGDAQKTPLSDRGITRDADGRISAIQRGDGSTSQISYDGSDKEPSKITTTNKDGSTITFEKKDDRWTQTITAQDGTTSTNPNLDAVSVDGNGNVTTKEGTVTEVFQKNGTRDVTAQAGDDGPKTHAIYSYNKDGELRTVQLTTPDGQSQRFSYSEKTGSWRLRTTGPDGELSNPQDVSNVRFNPDGGMSYDAGKAHVTLEAYGAKHVAEDTSYGSYEQSFDPTGKLTATTRRDNTTGQTELVTYGKDGKGSLLVYDTQNPENYYTAQVDVHADGSYSYTDKDGQHVDRTRDLTDDGLNQTPFDPAVEKTAKDNGLDVTRRLEDGHFVYDYSVEINGDRQTLLSSDNAPDQVNDQLRQMRDQKLDAIEHDHNVKLSRDGETTEVDGEQIATKTPNLGQLYGVEAAIVRSEPDVKNSADGKPLEIDFLTKQGKNEGVGGFATGNRVVIEPNGGEDGGANAVEHLFLHEIAHNGQHDLYGDDKNLETEYGAQLGYVKSGDDWLLLTKDGRYFKSVPPKDGVGSDHWIRTDKDGHPLDENGNRSDDHPQEIDNDELRKIALVEPATTYFPNPAEAGAEAASMFRGGETSRANFLRENPSAYNAIKDLDQLDLNKTYGLDENGEPKYIRNPDGIPVPNTAENRQEVQDFEQGVLDGFGDHQKQTDEIGKKLGQAAESAGMAGMGVGG